MKRIVARAPAKLNLTLDVVDRRADGYHILNSLMQTVDRYDTLTATATDGPVTLTVEGAEPCPPEKNTAVRAAQLFLRHCGLSAGAALHLKKTIPQQAGMGGGSADAAAALAALDRLFGTALPKAELLSLALEVGADVPFCLHGGTAMVTGIGETICPLPLLPPLAFVVAKPPEGISTAEAYRAVDAAPLTRRPDNAAARRAVQDGDLAALLPQFINVFSAATALPGVEQIRRSMLSLGAHAACMTGSGSAVFGVFVDDDAADRCAAALSAQWDTVFVCHPCSGIDLSEQIV